MSHLHRAQRERRPYTISCVHHTPRAVCPQTSRRGLPPRADRSLCVSSVLECRAYLMCGRLSRPFRDRNSQLWSLQKSRNRGGRSFLQKFVTPPSYIDNFTQGRSKQPSSGSYEFMTLASTATSSSVERAIRILYTLLLAYSYCTAWLLDVVHTEHESNRTDDTSIIIYRFIVQSTSPPIGCESASGIH